MYFVSYVLGGGSGQFLTLDIHVHDTWRSGAYTVHPHLSEPLQSEGCSDKWNVRIIEAVVITCNHSTLKVPSLPEVLLLLLLRKNNWLYIPKAFKIKPGQAVYRHLVVLSLSCHLFPSQHLLVVLDIRDGTLCNTALFSHWKARYCEEYRRVRAR